MLVATSITDSFNGGMETFFRDIPGVIGGFVILVLGWIIAGLIGRLVRTVLDRAGADRITQRAGINGFLTRAGMHDPTAGKVFGFVATWYIRVLAIEGAVNAFGIPQLSLAVGQIFSYIPLIFAALLIVLIGAFLAKIAGEMVARIARGYELAGADAIGTGVQVAVLFLTAIATLEQLSIAGTVAQTLLIAVLALVVGAGILGIGLAIGLGGRDTAAEIIHARLGPRAQGQGLRLQGVPANGPDTTSRMTNSTPPSVPQQGDVRRGP